ncbi:Hsp20/alpha crystallin family protein [Asanoa sp. NPDC049573]|uniref:Hsp20/alpha crystallin family protein n=1 Tax=Asanoa sp. NPDC049573 TaxID=3155396 RepID=UPI003414A556
MSTATLRSHSLFPIEWPRFTWLSLGGQSFRIEEFLDGKDYVIRAELPGVDPQKDIHLAVHNGALNIKVERADERGTEEGKLVHSEFHYGSLYRQIPLPSGAHRDKVTATYETGILEVRIAVGDSGSRTHEIQITVGNGKSTTVKKS